MKETEQIVQEVGQFITTIKEVQEQNKEDKYSVDEQQFTLLLSGISTCRKIPGINRHMGYEKLYLCETEEERELVREHMMKTMQVADKEALGKACFTMFHTGEEYRDFWGFWNDNPTFPIEQLTPEAKELFEKCKNYAKNFEPFVKERGFAAWDINERIGLCRTAVACGMITEDEFWNMTANWVKQAVMLYHSWEEYAVSCLCGAVYFMFGNGEFREEGIKVFFDLNRKILLQLLSENGVWGRHEWLDMKVKQYAIPPMEIKELLLEWKGADGCIASDRITVDGCKVGFMYRKEPAENRPDSGWRFFAGDETEDYAKNPDNLGIYRLNTICNYDPDILPFLFAPVGTAFSRGEDGTFQLESGKPNNVE